MVFEGLNPELDRDRSNGLVPPPLFANLNPIENSVGTSKTRNSQICD